MFFGTYRLGFTSLLRYMKMILTIQKKKTIMIHLIAASTLTIIYSIQQAKIKFMNIQHTSNNVPYETNWTAKLACLLPIKNTHTLDQVQQAKYELDAKYLDYDVEINWQNA